MAGTLAAFDALLFAAKGAVTCEATRLMAEGAELGVNGRANVGARALFDVSVHLIWVEKGARCAPVRVPEGATSCGGTSVPASAFFRREALQSAFGCLLFRAPRSQQLSYSTLREERYAFSGVGNQAELEWSHGYL